MCCRTGVVDTLIERAGGTAQLTLWRASLVPFLAQWKDVSRREPQVEINITPLVADALILLCRKYGTEYTSLAGDGVALGPDLLKKSNKGE